VVFFVKTNKQHVIIIKMSASESDDSVEEHNPFMDFRENADLDVDCDDFVALQKGAVEFRAYLNQLSSQRPLALENCPTEDRITEPQHMPDQTDDKEKIEFKLKLRKLLQKYQGAPRMSTPPEPVIEDEEIVKKKFVLKQMKKIIQIYAIKIGKKIKKKFPIKSLVCKIIPILIFLLYLYLYYCFGNYYFVVNFQTFFK
jgi:hypothetical protein